MPVTSALILLLTLAQSVERGIEAFHRGDYLAAARELEKSADSPQQRVFLGLSRAGLGQCDAVLERESASNADADLRRLAGLGFVQCALAKNRFDDAQPILARLLREFPSHEDVLYQAARLHLRAWNDVVQKMYERAPASYRVNQLSAEIFEIQGRYPDAIAEYRKAVAKNPAALALHYRLGRAILLESHDPAHLDDARREFEAELKLNPRDAVAEFQIGQIDQTAQKSAEAARRFERAIALQPDFAEALLALARLHLAAKRNNDAIALLTKTIALQPRNEGARYSLMLAYRNSGRLADAQAQKNELDKLQKRPEGEFADFLKRIGEAPKQP